MPQTLLALCAILMFSLFALAQHDAKADAEQFAITGEIEQSAARLARQRLATVLSKAFDEADVSVVRMRTRTTGLSSIGPDNAAGDEIVEAQFDDVDDFHGSSVGSTAGWMGQTLNFNSTVTVRYVSLGPSGVTTSTAPTLSKEVTVVVRAAPSGFVGTPPIAATLSQIVTPGSN